MTLEELRKLPLDTKVTVGNSNKSLSECIQSVIKSYCDYGLIGNIDVVLDSLLNKFNNGELKLT